MLRESEPTLGLALAVTRLLSEPRREVAKTKRAIKVVKEKAKVERKGVKVQERGRQKNRRSTLLAGTTTTRKKGVGVEKLNANSSTTYLHLGLFCFFPKI